MSKPTTLLFDVGDVLLNWNASAEALADELQVSRDQLLDVVFTYADDMFVGSISTIDGWKMILKDLKKDNDPWQMVLKWRDRPYWFDDTLELMSDLKAAGYEINIMTNSWLGLNEKRDKDLLPKEILLVSHIFDSSLEKVKKPDIHFYEIVENRLNDHGSNLMLIDDSIKNKEPADKLSWQFFNYVTADGACKKSAERLRKLLLPK